MNFTKWYRFLNVFQSCAINEVLTNFIHSRKIYVTVPSRSLGRSLEVSKNGS